MNFVTKMKVREKLVLLVTILLFFIILLSGVGYYSLDKSHLITNKMYNENLLAIEYIYDVRTMIRRTQEDTYRILLEENDAERQQYFNDITETKKTIENDISKFQNLSLNKDILDSAKDADNKYLQYVNIQNEIIQLGMHNSNEQGHTLYKEKGDFLLSQFYDDQYTLIKKLSESADQMNIQNEDYFKVSSILFIIITMAAILLSILIGWVIIKQISKNLNKINEIVKDMANGDFSNIIANDNLNDKSEFGDLSRNIAIMTKNIATLLKKITHSSDTLAASSEELTASAEQSAQASNQVAASVTRVAESADKQLQLSNKSDSAVKNISTSMEKLSVNTNILSDSVEKTTKAANKGDIAINKTIEQMHIIKEKTNATSSVITDLENKSQQIGKIVDVISNIAGQTNLLALNAAIEAARAGDAGKGFSVVAEEVRKLAEQSQDAAKQITELITDVQHKTDNAVTFMTEGKAEVEKGTEVVSMAGENFEQIISMVNTMLTQIGNNAHAVDEITNYMENVATLVNETDKESRKSSAETQTISAAAEEQSASSEEIASASQALSKMAAEVQNNIRTFKV
ncbi:methyl-accepting chemotaxis protein [Pectinatus haikarae]|uniref:Methyl-accepting chemotaxis protein n=1 Tax=Pectinatus haikarae TaxID=349096 RepID=A0ABT9Y6W3_9FIRM|nr:methyl-accepting chemotaxis protein [Pectinatus haikarae]MDQ0203567.1 methyl-accepting chemotaxis protein [Pectinatus haikarae]